MAVTARFIADFTSFNAAVQKAEVSLRGFEGDANKVTKSLERMTDQFSGRKVVQEALLMEKAIASIGGVAQLTAKELQRAGATASEAIEIMKKGGREVPPGLQKIATEAKNAQSGFAGLIGTAGKLAGALGIGLSVGAAVSFGKSILADADALVKLSDKTGLGIQGLQKFQIAGDDAGNSIDQMASAITKMQDRLVGGDKSFIGAMKTLNIDLATFAALKPEDQFIAISDALRGVVDPAEQVNLAIDLFGKAGADVLPVLKRGFDDVKNAAVGMSDETVKALDKAGDKLSKWWREFKGFTAEAIVFLAELPGKIGFGIDEEALFGAKARNQSPAGADRNTEVKNLGLAAKNAAPEVEKLHKAVVKLSEFKGIKALADDFSGLGQSFKVKEITQNFDDFIRTGVHIKDLGQDFSGLGKQIGVTALAAHAFRVEFRPGDVGIPQASDQVEELTSTLGHLSDLFVRLGSASGGSMGEFLGGIGQVAVILDASSKAFSENGTKAEKWAVSIAAASAAVEVFSAKTAKSGAIAGAKAGSAFGPWGTVIGAVAGGLIGHAAAKRQVNDMRDEFQKLTFGTFPAMAKAANAAGHDLSALLNVRGAKELTAEIEKLKAAIQFQDSAMQRFDDTLKKYNLDIGEIGAAGATRLLGKEANDLYTDFKVLEAGGVDASVAITGMQDALSQLVRDSIKTGVALPKQFETIIKQMRDLGLLTDDVGEHFTDAELDGLSFGGTLTDGVNALTDAIRELTDAIGRGLGNAIRNLPAIPGAGGGLGRNPGGGAEPPSSSLSPATVARVFSGGGGMVQVTSILNMDGREVGRGVSVHQMDDRRTRVKSRAA